MDQFGEFITSGRFIPWALVVALMIWIYRSGKKDAEPGPQTLVAKKYQVYHMLLNPGLVILAVLIAVAAIWVGVRVFNTAAPVGVNSIDDLRAPWQEDSTQQPGGDAAGNTGGGQSGGGLQGTFTVNWTGADKCATLRDGPSGAAPELGCVPNGTQVTVDQTSTDGTRVHIKPVGGFPAGWIHVSTLAVP